MSELSLKFREDVESRAMALSGVEPGKYAAVDWGKFSGLLNKLDAVVQKAAPIIETFTPAQYDVYVEMAAWALHEANNKVNPPKPAFGDGLAGD